jgi:hypothetical protein
VSYFCLFPKNAQFKKCQSGDSSPSLVTLVDANMKKNFFNLKKELENFHLHPIVHTLSQL